MIFNGLRSVFLVGQKSLNFVTLETPILIKKIVNLITFLKGDLYKKIPS